MTGENNIETVHANFIDETRIYYRSTDAAIAGKIIAMAIWTSSEITSTTEAATAGTPERLPMLKL